MATNVLSLCSEVDIQPIATVESHQANILQGLIPNSLQTVERSLLSKTAELGKVMLLLSMVRYQVLLF